MVVTPAERDARARDYYRDRFRAHGPTPRGVDWNGPATQQLQFEQLMKVVRIADPCTVNDLGCGYGALADWLCDRGRDVRYHGYDVNAGMIDVARSRHAGRENVSFDVADRPLFDADYGVASGIFTLRFGRGDDECRSDMIESLDTLDRSSRHGFAFNCLTSYSDADRMADHLWYPDPCDVFDLCKRRYARNVALLHDYDLYGFTIVVTKIVPASGTTP